MSIRSRSPLTVAVLVLVLGGVAAAAGLAYLFLRPAPPPPVALATSSPGASIVAATAGASPTGGSAGLGGLDGTWTVDPSVGDFADFSSSFVGYRIDETFTDQRANTAVGRTPIVSGSLVLDGSSVTAVEITADLTALQSDDDRRDGQLRRQAIETERFPTAAFTLTAPIELGSVPVDGQAITATATGMLTLHGVTRSVEVPIQALLHGDVVTVTGSLEIQLADYEIEQPRSFIVLSIEDHGIMELQLHFRRG